MAVKKLAISLEPDLAEEIVSLAGREKVSVSRWLSEAAREHIRRQAAYDALTAYEEEFEPLTDEDREAARRFWREG
jgi:hypothetical protein